MIPKVTILDRDSASDLLLAELYAPTDLCCVLSLNDYNTCSPPNGFDDFGGHKLALFFDDVLCDKYGYIAPTPDDARKIVAWAKGVKGPSLIHCALGVSRSTASALAIASVFERRRDFATAMAHMRWLVQIRNVANPNPLLVRFIDDEMCWNGTLCEARLCRFGA